VPDEARRSPIAAAVETPVRFVTAASLFDGHDASINIMRRILQAQGAEVIHLGHNRSVDEIVTAAVQEDAHGIAISSYQGGHVEYFKYMVDMLKERGGEHIRVFGGGGGTITLDEIKAAVTKGTNDNARAAAPGAVATRAQVIDNRPATVSGGADYTDPDVIRRAMSDALAASMTPLVKAEGMATRFRSYRPSGMVAALASARGERVDPYSP